MKTYIVSILLALFSLSACANVPEKEESSQSETVVYNVPGAIGKVKIDMHTIRIPYCNNERPILIIINKNGSGVYFSPLDVDEKGRTVKCKITGI